MTAHTQHVLREALTLSLDERAEVISELIASLDGEPDADAESAWSAELDRRARRARDGLSKGTPWETVRNRIENRLGD